MKVIKGGVTAANGFQAAGLSAGIKKGNTKHIILCLYLPQLLPLKTLKVVDRGIEPLCQD